MRLADETAEDSALKIAQRVTSREVTATEVIASCLSRIEAFNPAVMLLLQYIENVL